MDDRIRISDADRDRATARLREHFAEGRLTPDELDARITAALSARTYGDLRAVMADLPGSTPVPPAPPPGPPWAGPPWAGPPWAYRRWAMVPRGPRLLPLAIVVLIAAVVIPGAGWLFFAFVKLALAVWLIACLAGIIAAARFRRHVRRYWRDRQDGPWHPYRRRQFGWRG